MNNWVSLLDFQAVVSNKGSVIKTDGSGLTLLAMQLVLVAQLHSSQLQNRHSLNAAPANPEIWFQPESRAEQYVLILAFCFQHSC